MIRFGDDYVIVVTAAPTVDGRVWSANFMIHEIAGHDADGATLYSHDTEMVTADLAEAAVRAGGLARWDGCITLTIHAAHACTHDHVDRLFGAVRRALKECAAVVAGGALKNEYP